MQKTIPSYFWLVISAVLITLTLTAVLVLLSLRNGIVQTQRAIQPVNELTSSLATQIAQVMHPTPTVIPDPVTIIHSIRSLARLETIQYSVEKVIVAENNQGPFGFLFGDRLLLVAHGTVIAGIDLDKIKPEDIWIENGILYIRMPEAEILTASLDNQQSYVYNRDTGVLTKGDINLETIARQAAEDEIREAALKDGILSLASQNAEVYLDRLLNELGFPEVIFEPVTPTP